MAFVPSEDGFGYEPLHLADLQQDANGSDLAIARVDTDPRIVDTGLSVATDGPLTYGDDVWTFGYPFTRFELAPEGPRYNIDGRYLEGYVQRPFDHEHFPGHGRVPFYELSLPAPEGLSGVPLVKTYSTDVVGGNDRVRPECSLEGSDGLPRLGAHGSG